MQTCSDLFTACFHVKTAGYNDHFSSSSHQDYAKLAEVGKLFGHIARKI